MRRKTSRRKTSRKTSRRKTSRKTSRRNTSRKYKRDITISAAKEYDKVLQIISRGRNPPGLRLIARKILQQGKAKTAEGAISLAKKKWKGFTNAQREGYNNMASW